MKTNYYAILGTDDCLQMELIHEAGTSEEGSSPAGYYLYINETEDSSREKPLGNIKSGKILYKKSALLDDKIEEKLQSPYIWNEIEGIRITSLWVKEKYEEAADVIQNPEKYADERDYCVYAEDTERNDMDLTYSEAIQFSEELVSVGLQDVEVFLVEDIYE